MPATIEPEPTASEREVILAALADSDRRPLGGWADASLAEGVEEDQLDP